MKSNGNHDLSWEHPLHSQMLIDFFEHYLRGVANNWQQTPHLQVLHEMSRVDLQPQWLTPYDRLPQPQPQTLYLRADGQLATTPVPGDATPREYVYPLLSTSTNPLPGSAPGLDFLWQLLAPAAGRLVWTIPALAQDWQLLGSASLDVWLSSTAPDTDLQVTLSEVRPDGEESTRRVAGYVPPSALWTAVVPRRPVPSMILCRPPLRTSFQASPPCDVWKSSPSPTAFAAVVHYALSSMRHSR